ncbi:MAG: N-acetyltransferase family protein [Limisphaerales bacterium]
MTADVQCSRVRPEDLKAVAEVHLRAFPESALSWLGLEAVRRYYEWQLSGPHDHEFVGVRHDRKLVGYAVAGVSRGAMSGFVRRNRGFLACRVLMQPWLICTSRFRGRLRLGLRSLSSGRPSPPPARAPSAARSFGVLAIAIAPAAQGQGLGKLLMNQLEKVAVERGYNRMHLTVGADNAGAIAFYERLGWTKMMNGGHWGGGMVKGLAVSSVCSAG